jgi:hypothetical protein
LLVVSGVFPRQLNLDIQSATVRNAVPCDVAFAVVPHVDKTAVFRKELPDRMVSGNAAVLTEGYDDLVLQNRLLVNRDRLLVLGGDLVSLWLK